jgi:predicted nucleotidyltransferase
MPPQSRAYQKIGRSIPGCHNVPMDLRYDPSALARLAGQEQVALIVLFGSQTKGKAGPMSDIDIGVLYKKYPEHPYDSFRKLTVAFENDNLDLVDLNQENPHSWT